jgi:nucleotide-binding universal stress UspA family protein
MMMIPKYKTILYTTDLAPNSRPVLRHAIGIAQRYGAKVYMVHVVAELDPSHKNYLSALIGEERFKEQSENLNREIIETIRERLKVFTEEELNGHPEYMDALAGIEVLHGHPTDQILKMADKLNADLLVIGSHGKGVLGHNLLGSVAHRVLRRTRRPVLVVPVVEGSENTPATF